MQDYKAILEPNSYYHIYNRANGSEKLFLNEANYLYFLQKYNFYISPIADTFAYCLMPNHFHFLVRIKANNNTSDVSKASDVYNPSEVHLQGFKNLEGVNISQVFSNFFNAYTKAFNKQNQRKGSLFIPRFNRKKISSEAYLKNTLNYIHQNPIAHGYVTELDDWKYSSYASFFSSKESKINKTEVLNWFNDLDNFTFYHNFKKAEQLGLEMGLAY